MEIAFICWEFPPKVYGGLGIYGSRMAKALKEKGHNVTVFAYNDGSFPLENSFEGIDVFRCRGPPIKFGLESFFSKDMLTRWGEGINFLSDFLGYNIESASLIKTMAKKKHFDLVVSHDWLGLPGGMSVKEALKIPLIYHVHSTEIGRSLCQPNPEILDLEVKGSNTSDLVITVSHAMKDELEAEGVRNKIAVCYNGIDANKTFNPKLVDRQKSAQIREEFDIGHERMILFVGRLEPFKGIIQLIQSMPMVLEENPFTKLVILGRGSIEDAVRKTISDLNLKGRVFIKNEFVNDETKIHYYDASDVCVFPSLYEPFGIVALEAMAMERPVVVGARGVSGFREIVIPPPSKDAAGMHVNPNDPKDIAWGINTVFKNPTNAKKWGKNGRMRTLKEFTWDKIARKTIELYKNIIM